MRGVLAPMEVNYVVEDGFQDFRNDVRWKHF